MILCIVICTVFAFCEVRAILGLMESFLRIYKPILTASALALAFCGPLAAQSVDVEALLGDLADPETQNWQSLERQIQAEWSKSGSPAMDLLLQRGLKALEAKDYALALDHFTALTDHAPDFAEGWNGRATALFNKNMYGPALEDIGKVLTLNPDHYGAMTGLAVILNELGDKKRALAAWKMVAAINPHRPETRAAIEQLEKETGGSTL